MIGKNLKVKKTKLKGVIEYIIFDKINVSNFHQEPIQIIDIKDIKKIVYVYNCEDTKLTIKGKFKSLLIGNYKLKFTKFR